MALRHSCAMLILLLSLLIEATAPAGKGVTEGVVVDKYPALAIGSQQPHIRRVKVLVVWDDKRDVRSEWVVDDDVYRSVIPGQRISRTRQFAEEQWNWGE